MKKIFTLAAMLLLVSVGSNAQWRKSWDFSKGWSEETKANLNADTQNWTVNRTDANTGEATGWKDKTKMYGTLMANGVEIEELRGLDFLNKGLSGGDYLLDPGTIRLSRKTQGFTLPKVAAGQKITLMAKSANATATDRGFTGDENLDYIEGPANGICAGPDGLQTLVWQVKSTVEDSVAVTISTPSGGLDIQLIMIDNGDEPETEEAKNVAYVTDLNTADMDFFNILLNGSEKVTLNMVDASEASSLEALQEYDAVVVSQYVSADAAIVPTLKSAVAYTPMLNMSTALYEAWGYGNAVATDETTLNIAEAYRDNAIFEGLDIENGLEILSEGTLSAVELGSYFANDAVWATVGEGTGIHQHNASRNAYMLIPLNTESVLSEEGVNFVADATVLVARTKKDIVAAGKPAITKVNKNLATEVTITVTNPASTIYYTIDGTEPTEASSVYTAPFTLTEATTVKAIATLDGYTVSDVASLDINIMSQAATPTFSMVKNADNTEVTISCATEGVDIYYSYNKITEAGKAQKYTEPIVLSEEPTMIYAFAAGGDYVQSELGDAYVSINSLTAETIRLDTLAHFDANQDDWYLNDPEVGGTGAASAYYYFGKSAWNYYSTEVDYTETVKDSQGNDSIITYYKPDASALRIATPLNANGWVMKTSGQVLTGELTLAAVAEVGNGNANRYADTAEDMIGGTPSKGAITFGAKLSGEPYSASIETTEKYAAPFDVVTYVGNGNNGSASDFEVQISADGETWNAIGNVKMAATQRYYKKTRISCNESGEYYVRIAHVSGGTKGQVYDIYILNNGEESKTYEPTGIENVTTAAGEPVADEVYSINGVRQNGLQKGINIVRKHYADGSVKTVKVVVK